jgi:hypothetical protein
VRHLILDYLRRWKWVLAAVALNSFWLGWFLAAPSVPGGAEPRPGEWLFVILEFHRAMFATPLMFVALMAGAGLLVFDLQRGATRVIAAMPLTGGQIGRSWWLATVLIPALAWAALLFLGAALSCQFNSDATMPWVPLALAGPVFVLWLAVTFTMFVTGNQKLGFAAHPWGCLLAILGYGLLFWTIFGGGIMFKDPTKTPLKSAVCLLGFVFIAVFGWVRANHLDFAVRTPLPAKTNRFVRSVHQALSETTWLDSAPAGPGGLRFLLATQFRLTFFTCVAVIVWGLVWSTAALAWKGNLTRDNLLSAMAFVPALWVLVYFLLTPVLRHLRVLRTLPVSASRLALALLALQFLPVLALGLLAMGAIALVQPGYIALPVLQLFILGLVPAAACLVVGVWGETGTPASILFVVISLNAMFIAASQVDRKIPVAISSAIAALSILLAYFFIRLVLTRSHHAFHAPSPPNPSLASS